MAGTPTGVHHLAFMAGDIKKHIDFFSQVVGAPLVALFDMHGVPGGLHAFLKLSDSCYFSIVQLPDVDKIPIEIGKSHAGTGAGVSAPGTLQHLAFNVDSEADLLAIRDRIRSHGITVMGPLDHGMCKSIYFAGPDQMTLEVATAGMKLDPDLWIDPTVLEKAGINADEALRFRNPAAYDGPSPVAQPALDPSKPLLAYPEERLKMMMSLPDEVIWESSKANAQPPVAAI